MTRYPRKPKGAYHHPDLESALVETAARMIAEEGVAALTLRGVGERLGVSRTALYRHFEDKAALVARVALEGFQRFRDALAEAVAAARAGRRDPIEAMGIAYLAFALANPSHYQTMFSGAVEDWERNPDLGPVADSAFRVLLDTIVAEQRAGHVRRGNPEHLARVVWASVHGIAMLTIAGQFEREEYEELGRVSTRVLRDGLR